MGCALNSDKQIAWRATSRSCIPFSRNANFCTGVYSTRDPDAYKLSLLDEALSMAHRTFLSWSSARSSAGWAGPCKSHRASLDSRTAAPPANRTCLLSTLLCVASSAAGRAGYHPGQFYPCLQTIDGIHKSNLHRIMEVFASRWPLISPLSGRAKNIFKEVTE